MHQNLENYMILSYPELFPLGYNKEQNFGISTYGFECGDGWFMILDNLCSSIYYYCKHKKIDFPKVVQVKEKFGTLRFYTNGHDDTIDKLISFAEAMTTSTCEVCGNIGKTRNGGWIRTLCDTHNQMYLNGEKLYTEFENVLPTLTLNNKITIIDSGITYIGNVVDINTLEIKIINVFKENKSEKDNTIIGTIQKVKYLYHPLFSYYVFDKGE